MDNDYLLKIKKYHEMAITDVLEWDCPETAVEDWDNVPETSAQLLLYLQKHSHAIVKYLQRIDVLESTASLRKFTEI